MNIYVCLGDVPPEPWVLSLQNAMPEATVTAWKPGLPQADYAVVWSPPQQFIDEQSCIKAVFNIGAGVDGLLQLALPSSIKIIRVEDAGMSAQMAEYVCHAVVRHFRNFNYYESNKQLSKWTLRKTKNRDDFAVGIMGLGILGMHVAKTLCMFGYPVNGYSRTLKEIEGINCFSSDSGLWDFLNNTRILINLLPLTAETENILNRNTLSKLQPGGYVVNVARGKHLVDQDLIDLIDAGHLSGATLDVFREEPLPADHQFWKHPKITVTPHIAARTQRENSVRQIADKIRSLEQDENVTGIIDLQRGY